MGAVSAIVIQIAMVSLLHNLLGCNGQAIKVPCSGSMDMNLNLAFELVLKAAPDDPAVNGYLVIPAGQSKVAR